MLTLPSYGLLRRAFPSVSDGRSRWGGVEYNSENTELTTQFENPEEVRDT